MALWVATTRGNPLVLQIQASSEPHFPWEKVPRIPRNGPCWVVTADQYWHIPQRTQHRLRRKVATSPTQVQLHWNLPSKLVVCVCMFVNLSMRTGSQYTHGVQMGKPWLSWYQTTSLGEETIECKKQLTFGSSILFEGRCIWSCSAAYAGGLSSRQLGRDRCGMALKRRVLPGCSTLRTCITTSSITACEGLSQDSKVTAAWSWRIYWTPIVRAIIYLELTLHELRTQGSEGQPHSDEWSFPFLYQYQACTLFLESIQGTT